MWHPSLLNQSITIPISQSKTKLHQLEFLKLDRPRESPRDMSTSLRRNGNIPTNRKTNISGATVMRININTQVGVKVIGKMEDCRVGTNHIPAAPTTKTSSSKRRSRPQLQAHAPLAEKSNQSQETTKRVYQSQIKISTGVQTKVGPWYLSGIWDR